MHEFRWLAPAAVRLSTIPGARDRYPERDQAFWRQIAADVTAPGWEFPLSLIHISEPTRLL